jgi:hypothetical protein
MGIVVNNERGTQYNQQQLHGKDAPVPSARTHAVKVGTAEGDKQYYKQYPRQDEVEELVHHSRCLIQCWSEIKNKIDHNAGRHRHWQGPFFQEIDKLVHYKLRKSTCCYSE